MRPARNHTLTAILLFLAMLLTQVYAQEASGFAKGLVIYKATAGEQPEYYSATLYRSSRISTPWMEYDVGQTKPLFVQAGFVIEEIAFGGMFEADFVNDTQAAACSQMQQRLTAAGRSSPKVAAVAQAVNGAIQKQLDSYQKGLVRYKGRWLSKSEYQVAAQAIANAEMERQKALNAARAAASSSMTTEQRRKAQEEEIAARSSKPRASAETAVIEAVDARGISKVLLTGYDDLLDAARTTREKGGRSLSPLEASVISLSKKLPAAEDGAIQSGLYTAGEKGGCAMLWAAQDGKVLAADIGMVIMTDVLKETLQNSSDVALAKAQLARFDEQLIALIPDAIAAAKIRAVLQSSTARADDSSAGGNTVFERSVENQKIEIRVGPLQTQDDGGFRQELLFKLRPR